MDNEDVKGLIKKSLEKLIENDGGLIHRKVREECINHRLSCHLEHFLKRNGLNCHVDLEYNKNYDNPKKIIIDEHNNTKAIRPDIIVHIRETNKYNFIAFEIKKSYTDRHDLEKIKGLLKKPYNYKYGCLISYLPAKNYIKVKLLSNRGQRTEEFRISKNG